MLRRQFLPPCLFAAHPGFMPRQVADSAGNSRWISRVNGQTAPFFWPSKTATTAMRAEVSLT